MLHYDYYFKHATLTVHVPLFLRVPQLKLIEHSTDEPYLWVATTSPHVKRYVRNVHIE